MPQSAEIELQPPAVGTHRSSNQDIALGPDDFQRIGIQPKETRLAVIRRAASRAAKSLARRQLSVPDTLTEQQLSQVAVSTYRLLDPRQRDDRQSRAHVGRIRAGDLYRAGKTAFAGAPDLMQQDEIVLTQQDEIAAPPGSENCHFDRDARSGLQSPPIEETISAAMPPIISLHSVKTEFHRPESTLARVRRQSQQPAWIIAIIIALLMATVALWFWGRGIGAPPERFKSISSQVDLSR